MASSVWTIAELNRAKQLHESGLTAREIGILINRSKGGVINALRYNGIEMRRGRPKSDDPWAEDESRTAKQALIGSQKLLAAIQIAGVRP
jgi:hypothetical protein